MGGAECLWGGDTKKDWLARGREEKQVGRKGKTRPKSEGALPPIQGQARVQQLLTLWLHRWR